MNDISVANNNSVVARPFATSEKTYIKTYSVILALFALSGGVSVTLHYCFGLASPGAAWACGGVGLFSTTALIILYFSKTPSPYERMLTLVQEGKVEEAWELYLDTSYKEKKGEACIADKNGRKPHGNYLYADGYVKLPPEKLLIAAVEHWVAAKKDIQSKMCPNALTECAIAYASFRSKCLEDPKVWHGFMGYESRLADIAKQHASFGLAIMTSSHGEDIWDSNLLIEIFQASIDEALTAIKNNQLSEQHLLYLANFLLSYKFVIHADAFEKVQSIGKALYQQRDLHSKGSELHGQYTNYIHMFELVEGKLAFQGIYSKVSLRFEFPKIEKIDKDLVARVFQTDWIEDISRKIPAEQTEEGILKGLLYLSMIPESSENYLYAQIMLGNVWMELGNFQEAGRYFLKAAALEAKNTSDTVKLASVCLLARVKKEDKWEYILREDMEDLKKAGHEVRTLSFEGIQDGFQALMQLRGVLEDLRKAKAPASSQV